MSEWLREGVSTRANCSFWKTSLSCVSDGLLGTLCAIRIATRRIRPARTIESYTDSPCTNTTHTTHNRE